MSADVARYNITTSRVRQIARRYRGRCENTVTHSYNNNYCVNAKKKEKKVDSVMNYRRYYSRV